MEKMWDGYCTQTTHPPIREREIAQIRTKTHIRAPNRSHNTLAPHTQECRQHIRQHTSITSPYQPITEDEWKGCMREKRIITQISQVYALAQHTDECIRSYIARLFVSQVGEIYLNQPVSDGKVGDGALF